MALSVSTPGQPLVIVTSTPDRLAEPTLPPSPSRADKGSQVYWLNCSPCHGDRGQGLTDEFRQLYPPEDQNCWNSHCHGNVTYENGFTVPKVVPALIGPGALQKFPTAASLFAFTKAAMPFQKPGALTDEEYYQLLSFLLRENGLWTMAEGVTAENAADIKVGPPPVTSTPQIESSASVVSNSWMFWLIPFVFLIIFLVLKRLVVKKQNNVP